MLDDDLNNFERPAPGTHDILISLKIIYSGLAISNRTQDTNILGLMLFPCLFKSVFHVLNS